MTDKDKPKGLSPEEREGVIKVAAVVYAREAERLNDAIAFEQMMKKTAEVAKTMKPEEMEKYKPNYMYGRGYAYGFEMGKEAGANEAVPVIYKRIMDKYAELHGQNKVAEFGQAVMGEGQGQGQDPSIEEIEELATQVAAEELFNEIEASEGPAGVEAIQNDPQKAQALLQKAREVGQQTVEVIMQQSEQQPQPDQMPPGAAPGAGAAPPPPIPQ